MYEVFVPNNFTLALFFVLARALYFIFFLRKKKLVAGTSLEGLQLLHKS